VKEWLRTAGYSGPSPALVKAALIATAKSLTNQQPCGLGCTPCCSYCGLMRPAPDALQGWGGVSLDKLFHLQSDYYIVEQGAQFTAANQSVSYTVNVVDNTRDVHIALVWTDRASLEVGNDVNNLTNDLDLSVFVPTAGKQYYGNVYYSTANDCARTAYSLPNPVNFTRDRKNNVERITIRASDLTPMTGQAIVTITANRITGNGLNPFLTSPFVQDYALFIENAH
jgi:hypothetical protein